MNNVITNPVNLVIIIIGLFLGLFIGLFLLFNKSAKNKANLYLAFLVLLSITYFGQGFLFRFDLLKNFPHIIGTYRFVNFLIGPLTYFYVRACTQKGFEMRPILWLHFLPFALDLLVSLPFFLQSGSEKTAYFINLMQTGDTQRSQILHLLITVHSLTYFALATRLIFQYKKHLGNETSSIDHAFHSWVLVFITIHLLPVLGVMTFVFSPYPNFTSQFALLGFFIFSIAVFIAIMVKPELFHAFPHQMPLPNSTEEKKQKYEKSNLQETQKEQLTQKLLNHFEEKKPHLTPELTINDLATQTKIPTHYLSQIINEKMECNFIDFVNGYRVEAAKKLLAEDASKQFTILSIAYDAGFNSKSTFYAAFKKHAGTTPSGFRKSLNLS